jgi:hypothetical protein
MASFIVTKGSIYRGTMRNARRQGLHRQSEGEELAMVGEARAACRAFRESRLLAKGGSPAP